MLVKTGLIFLLTTTRPQFQFDLQQERQWREQRISAELQLNVFIDVTEAEFGKHNYYPNRIFNVDESGMSFVYSKIPKVVALKGKRQVGITAERGFLVTDIACMTAAEIRPSNDYIPKEKLQEFSGLGNPSWNSLHVSNIWLVK